MAKVAPIEHAERSGSWAQAVPWDSEQKASPGFASRKSLVKQTRHNVRHVLHRSGWYESAVAVGMRRFLRGRVFAVVALVALLLALFLRDICVLCQVSTNTELDVILTIVFALFAFEFIGLSFTDTSYLLGFFFWMDLVGTMSMIFDISYMLGSDATRPVRMGEGSGGENLVLVRAARATKLGARAGRLSRVLKILRFLPFIYSGDQQSKVKTAKIISNQLTDVLSTRVAFVVITLIVIVPLFTIFQYPVMDDSMTVWTELLVRNVKDYEAAMLVANTNAARDEARQRLASEMQSFADFYATLAYGPFSVCYGELVGSLFHCRREVLSIPFQSTFSRPNRNSSIMEVNKAMVQTSFDMSDIQKQEAAAAMGLICCMIIIMCAFSMAMSNSISIIALQPLERMLSVVRQRCKQIFKYTNDLKEVDTDDSEEEEEHDDLEEQVSEFMLLEKVVSKLAAIAHLSTETRELEIKDNMNEQDLMVANWMQGVQVRTTPRDSVVESTTPMDANGENEGTGAWRRTILKSLPQEILDSLAMEHFNALDLRKDLHAPVAAYIVISMEGSSNWVRNNVLDAQLLRFMGAVESRYMQNVFHNFAHGLDVLNSIAQYVQLINGDGFLSETSQFWMMIAAIAHDVGHLGVNNQYLVETSHDLALKYNDRSPLENMHCALLFKIASEPEADVFSQIERELFKEMRKGIIAVILHTDMTKHNDMIKEMGLLYQVNSEAFDAMEPGTAVAGTHAHVQLILNSMLHCADINNPMKPWDLCKRYAYLCIDEFFAQGDMERKAGIPVQMLNDRDKVNRPNSQVGFIEFAITPMVEVMVNLFPQLDSLAEHLGENIRNWSELWQEKSSPSADEINKVNARVQKVADRCQAVMRSQRNPVHHGS